MGPRPRGFEGLRWGRRSRATDFTAEKLRNANFCMLTKEQAGEIFDRIRRLSSADEVEVLFSGGRFALTRFANNMIHQNVAEENYNVSVRTVFGGRTARAFTNKFDEEGLGRGVGRVGSR